MRNLNLFGLAFLCLLAAACDESPSAPKDLQARGSCAGGELVVTCTDESLPTGEIESVTYRRLAVTGEVLVAGFAGNVADVTRMPVATPGDYVIEQLVTASDGAVDKLSHPVTVLPAA